MARMAKNNKASVLTFGDHEVIMPDANLRHAVIKGPPPPGEQDPVARAEQALSDLSDQFGAWMEMECDRLDRARRDIAAHGFTIHNKDHLFHAAHDIKGEAATFGYPAIAAAADSLCRLIEYTPDAARIPVRLVDQHVDAVRAIYREYAHADAGPLAAVLTRRLREVTDEFLLSENRSRPDVLKQITASTPRLA
jgi:HPt (histidine-containing phosphotransfer) domain-containing protein